jgi:hypothetical protein
MIEESQKSNRWVSHCFLVRLPVTTGSSMLFVHSQSSLDDRTIVVGAVIDALGGFIATTLHHIVKGSSTFQMLRDELDAGLPSECGVAIWQ